MANRTKGKITIEVEIDASGHRDSNYFMRMISKRINGLRCIGDSKVVGDSIEHETTKPQKDDKVRELNELKKVIKQGMPDIKYHISGSKNSMVVNLAFARDESFKLNSSNMVMRIG